MHYPLSAQLLRTVQLCQVYSGGPDPVGERSSLFTVYALDETLTLDADAGQAALFRAMDNHVLAKGQLKGPTKSSTANLLLCHVAS